MSPVIDKQQFENQSGGWVGAVVIGPKGDETGVAVEPGGTVWLSEAEQILTANAPRRPEDNPFLEQSTRRINPDSGEWETITVTPLVPIQRDRYIPANERPIPADLTGEAHPAGTAQVAATGAEPQTFTNADPVAEKDAEVRRTQELPSTPPKAAAAASAASTPQTPPSDGESSPPVTEPSASNEATAAESTGAAAAPSGDAPQGEYGAGEEVGTPDASDQTAVGSEGEQPRPPAQQPAPWTPQNNQ